MKKLIFSVLVFAFAALAVGVVQAQESPEAVAAKHGITFPVADLGNCGSVSECRTYCEDPVNQTTCVNFAKSKGLEKKVQVTDEEQGRMLTRAKITLGCDSFQSCSSLCSEAANYDKCHSFAQSQGVGGGYIANPEEKAVLGKAKEILGCDSLTACRDVCSDPANRDRCAEFAKQAGLRGGVEQRGPGGCTSPETCQSFCSDPVNYQICSGYAQGSGGKFSGPGGCDSEASCRSYCEQNPGECGYGGPGGSQPPGYNPQEMCGRTPNCAWKNNTCECGFPGGGTGGSEQQHSDEYAKFCQENPDKCRPDGTGGFDNKEQRQDFEKYCRENPDKCGATRPGDYPQPTGSGTQGRYEGYTPAPRYSAPSGSTQYNPPPQGGYSNDPATGCSQAGGSWVNGSCQFGGTSGGSSGGSNPPPPNTGSYTQPTQTEPQPQTQPQPAPDSGGSATQPQPQPEQQSAPQPAPDSGSTQPPPPAVQGATTTNVLQLIWGYFFTR